jgi:hypothetical protein
LKSTHTHKNENIQKGSSAHPEGVRSIHRWSGGMESKEKKHRVVKQTSGGQKCKREKRALDLAVENGFAIHGNESWRALDVAHFVDA